MNQKMEIWIWSGRESQTHLSDYLSRTPKKPGTDASCASQSDQQASTAPVYSAS